MRFNIVCDFDGTVALQDTTDLILSAFAAPEWQIIEQEWKNGNIGSGECMRQQIALIDASLPEIDALLDSVAIDPCFAAFAAFCAQRHLSLTIASDGVDYFIHRILNRAGLGHLPVRANRLSAVSEHTYRLDSPYETHACRSRSGHCKCAATAHTHRTMQILIGDGRSDFCLAHTADIVFAKSSLLTYCQQQDIRHFAFENFADVQAILASLIVPARQHEAELISTAIL